jgi:hypothetical protein
MNMHENMATEEVSENLMGWNLGKVLDTSQVSEGMESVKSV